MEKELMDNFKCPFGYACSECMVDEVCLDNNCFACISSDCENCARNPYNYEMEYYQINDCRCR